MFESLGTLEEWKDVWYTIIYNEELFLYGQLPWWTLFN